MARCTARRSSASEMRGKKPPSRCVATSGTTTTCPASSRPSRAATVDLPAPGPPVMATRQFIAARAPPPSAGPEQAISDVAEAGVHIALGSERLVQGGGVEVDVGVLVEQRLHALRARHQAHVAHGTSARLLH